MPKGLKKAVLLKDTPNSALGTIYRRAKSQSEMIGREYPRGYFLAIMREVFTEYNVRATALATADDFNFNHDVFGILRHYDATTGKLSDGFTPRFSTPSTKMSHARPAMTD